MAVAVAAISLFNQRADMARRSGMMTALQAALAGFSGGIEGRMQQRAADEEKSRITAALARQKKQDEESSQIRLADLMSQGFEPVADVKRKQQEAVGAAGSLIGSALNAASGNAGMPMPSAGAQASLAGGYAAAQPSRTIKFNDQEFALRETQPERQERLGRVESAMARAEKEQAARTSVEKTQAESKRVEKMVEDALKGGPKSKAAVKLALENASAYKAIFDDQTAGLSAAKRDQKMEDSRTAEAWFNTPIADPQERQRVATVFNNLRAAKPKASPQELMLDTFNAVKASAGLENVRAQAAQRTQAAQPNPMDDLLSGAINPAAGDSQKESMRYQLWNSTKAANPNMSDADVTAKVMREIP